MKVTIKGIGETDLTNETHPSHLPEGPFKTVFEHLWHQRREGDRDTPHWRKVGRVMDALISVPSATQRTEKS